MGHTSPDNPTDHQQHREEEPALFSSTAPHGRSYCLPADLWLWCLAAGG